MSTIDLFESSLIQSNLLKRAWWHIRDHVLPHPRNHYQPQMLHHRSLVAFSGLLVTVKVVALFWASFTPALPAYSSAITQDSVFELTNQSRSQERMSTLTYNTTLEKAAQAKADDMLARQYFAHNTPDGKTPWYFFDLVGYKYLSAGENLAVHFNDVEPLQDAWMNSPGHRANILNSSYKEMGVGISHGQFEGHDSIFVVEEFANPAVVAKPAVAPVVPATVPRTAVVAHTEVRKPLLAPLKAQASEDTQPVLQASVPSEIKLSNTKVNIEQQNVVISTTASENVSKMLLLFGPNAKFFRPTSPTSWSVTVPLGSVESFGLQIQASTLQGAQSSVALSTIAPTFASKYELGGNVASAHMTLFGKNIPVKVFEQRMYLGIMALLLTCLIIAIAVHRHIQHLRLIANTAFVVVFACLLLLV